MKYILIFLLSGIISFVEAKELPTEEEIYQRLVPYEKTRGLTIKKKEKASFDFDMINFDFDSAVINISSYEILRRIGNVLNRDDMVDVKFEIIGHTDNKGSDDYNQKLSEDRARSVKHYLIDNYKVKPISLLDSGKGESELLANIDGSNPKNRRVEISSMLD